MKSPTPLRHLCAGGALQKLIEPGAKVITNLPRAQYDQIPAFSASVLKHWITSGAVPTDFHYWMETRWDEPKSDALLIGAALDSLLLNDGRFSNEFVVVPADAPPRPRKSTVNAKKPSDASLAAISWWKEFDVRAAGRQVLTKDQYADVEVMLSSLLSSEACHGVFEHCHKAALYDEVFGYPAKAEVDLWNGKSDHIMDLKTARDVTPNGFRKAIRDFGYLYQAVWYLRLAEACGHKKRAFTWVVVRNEEPWSVQVYSFSPEEDPYHDLLYHRVSERLEEACTELYRRLGTWDFNNDNDWRLVMFQEWEANLYGG